jgi:8-oxo-dGTP pyrophosphatase MutT (NUDIX family)
MNQALFDTLANVTPLDTKEWEHLQAIRAWLRATTDIYRRVRPAIPDKHLAVYCVPLDMLEGRVLLGYHLAANMWLPPGGHVETNEHPTDAAMREYAEELGIAPVLLANDPLLASIEPTNGPGSHTDVTLWYAFQGSTTQNVTVDEREFRQMEWVRFEEIMSYPTNGNLSRFLSKVQPVA